jgi:hypothetical protein
MTGDACDENDHTRVGALGSLILREKGGEEATHPQGPNRLQQMCPTSKFHR